MIGGDANRQLAFFGRKIGPDPASIDAARSAASRPTTPRACVAASAEFLSHHGLHAADAGRRREARHGGCESVGSFRASHKTLLDGLAALSADARADADTVARIKRKFRLKNTTGYSINALIDFDDPVDILAHLMIGSEGTLGFLSRIDYRTAGRSASQGVGLCRLRRSRRRLPGGDRAENRAGGRGGVARPRLARKRQDQEGHAGRCRHARAGRHGAADRDARRRCRPALEKRIAAVEAALATSSR